MGILCARRGIIQCRIMNEWLWLKTEIEEEKNWKQLFREIDKLQGTLV